MFVCYDIGMNDSPSGIVWLLRSLEHVSSQNFLEELVVALRSSFLDQHFTTSGSYAWPSLLDSILAGVGYSNLKGVTLIIGHSIGHPFSWFPGGGIDLKQRLAQEMPLLNARGILSVEYSYDTGEALCHTLSSKWPGAHLSLQ